MPSNDKDCCCFTSSNVPLFMFLCLTLTGLAFVITGIVWRSNWCYGLGGFLSFAGVVGLFVLTCCFCIGEVPSSTQSDTTLFVAVTPEPQYQATTVVPVIATRQVEVPIVVSNVRVHNNEDEIDVASQLQRMALRGTKIDMVCIGLKPFLSATMSPYDKCTIVGFNNSWHPIVTSGSERQAVAMMVKLPAMCCGQSEMYDALRLSIDQFVASTADHPTRPCVLVVVTDGNGADTRVMSTQASEKLRAFNAQPSHHSIIIGIESGVHSDALATFCETSGAMYCPIPTCHLLPAAFAGVALLLTESVPIDIEQLQAEGPDAVFARVQRTRLANSAPFNLFVVVDVSASMQAQ